MLCVITNGGMQIGVAGCGAIMPDQSQTATPGRRGMRCSDAIATSAMWMMRSQMVAAKGSCGTMSTERLPASVNSRSKPRISRLLTLSRLPVGSSQRTASDSVTKATDRDALHFASG